MWALCARFHGPSPPQVAHHRYPPGGALVAAPGGTVSRLFRCGGREGQESRIPSHAPFLRPLLLPWALLLASLSRGQIFPWPLFVPVPPIRRVCSLNPLFSLPAAPPPVLPHLPPLGGEDPEGEGGTGKRGAGVRGAACKGGATPSQTALRAPVPYLAI